MEKGEKPIKEGETITLDELVRRMQEAGKQPGTNKRNRLLFFNAAAALMALGLRLEEQDKRLAELTNAPVIVPPGGERKLRRVN